MKSGRFRMQWARIAWRTIRSRYGGGVWSQGVNGSLDSSGFSNRLNLRAASAMIMFNLRRANVWCAYDTPAHRELSYNGRFRGPQPKAPMVIVGRLRSYDAAHQDLAWIRM